MGAALAVIFSVCTSCAHIIQSDVSPHGLSFIAQTTDPTTIMSDDDDSSEDSFDVLRNVNPRTKDYAAEIWVEDPLFSLQLDSAERLCFGTDGPWEDEPYYIAVLPHEDDWERTGECMGSSDYLKTLAFGTLHGVPKEHLAALCKGGLHHNKSIQHFSIARGDFLGGRGFLALSSFFERTTTLESMSFIDCEAAAIENDDFAVHLAGALSKFSSLKSFESHLNPNMAHKVLASLAGHKELERIHLRSDDILGKKSSPALSAMLRGKPKLSSVTLELRLDDCNYMFGDPDFSAVGMLDDDGIAALSSGLCGKNAVKHLKIVGNRSVTPAGWPAFATALKSSRSVLETLCMPLNSVGNAGAIVIAHALAKNSALRVIDLASSTDITSRGWRAFCAVFESEDSALEKMSVWDCRIGEDVHLAWANSLADNNSLKKLCMAYSGHLSHAGRSVFRRILCNTSSIRYVPQQPHPRGSVDHP